MDQQIKKQSDSFRIVCLVGAAVVLALAGYFAMYAVLLCAEADPGTIRNWSQGAAGLCGIVGFVWYLWYAIRK